MKIFLWNWGRSSGFKRTCSSQEFQNTLRQYAIQVFLNPYRCKCWDSMQFKFFKSLSLRMCICVACLHVLVCMLYFLCALVTIVHIAVPNTTPLTYDQQLLPVTLLCIYFIQKHMWKCIISSVSSNLSFRLCNPWFKAWKE